MNGLNCESKRNNKFVIILITALVTIVVSLSIVGVILFNIPGLIELIELNFIVDHNFYGEKSDGEITNGVLSGYVDELNDKYAQYLPVDEAEDRSDRLNGVAEGLGLTVTKDVESNYIYIVRVFNDSSAKKAGLKKKDLIVSIDGESVAEIGYSAALAKIPREIGTAVRLTVLREGSYIDLEVEYSNIVEQTVFYEKIKEYGYIEITSFNSATVEQFYNALNNLQTENVKGLIFDLRDNGGGTVSSVGDILDRLLPKGDLMTVKYKNGNTKVMLESDSDEIKLPMTVLVNKNTASAAEVFASNIQEFEKGVLVGEKTFGKGIMQNTFSLLNGGDVVLTVAEYFTHNMTSYHGVGLTPDIEQKNMDSNEKYFSDILDDSCVISAIKWLDGECGE